MNWLKKIAQDHTFYHGTDSPPFEQFDPSKSTKEERHYNPLGEGLYVTDKRDFAKLFGKNVYPLQIPKDCKIKKFSPREQQSAIWDILRRAMQKVGINYWETTIQFKIILWKQIKKAKYSPYDAIMEAIAHITIEFPEKSQEFSEAIKIVATQKFSARYDVVIFTGTNDPNNIFVADCPTKEIIIFNPAFQKIVKGQS